VRDIERSVDDFQYGWEPKGSKSQSNGHAVVGDRMDSRMQWFMGSSLSGGVLNVVMTSSSLDRL
jgi:hypothetical protein